MKPEIAVEWKCDAGVYEICALSRERACYSIDASR